MWFNKPKILIVTAITERLSKGPIFGRHMPLFTLSTFIISNILKLGIQSKKSRHSQRQNLPKKEYYFIY